MLAVYVILSLLPPALAEETARIDPYRSETKKKNALCLPVKALLPVLHHIPINIFTA